MPERHLHILRRRMFITTILMSIGMVLSFSLVAYSFYQNHQRSQHDRFVLCEAQNHANDALRGVLILAESLSEHQKNISPQQRHRAINFYQRAINLIPDLDCHTGVTIHETR